MTHWTIDTLHAYTQRQLADLVLRLDERHESQQVAMHAALAGAEKAVEKAWVANDKRFEANNGYREQLAAQAATFLTRAEVDTRFINANEKTETRAEANATRIRELESRVNLMTGEEHGAQGAHTSTRLDLGNIVAMLALVVAALAVFLK